MSRVGGAPRRHAGLSDRHSPSPRRLVVACLAVELGAGSCAGGQTGDDGFIPFEPLPSPPLSPDGAIAIDPDTGLAYSSAAYSVRYECRVRWAPGGHQGQAPNAGETRAALGLEATAGAPLDPGAAQTLLARDESRRLVALSPNVTGFFTTEDGALAEPLSGRVELRETFARLRVELATSELRGTLEIDQSLYPTATVAMQFFRGGTARGTLESVASRPEAAGGSPLPPVVLAEWQCSTR